MDKTCNSVHPAKCPKDEDDQQNHSCHVIVNGSEKSLKKSFAFWGPEVDTDDPALEYYSKTEVAYYRSYGLEFDDFLGVWFKPGSCFVRCPQ